MMTGVELVTKASVSINAITSAIDTFIKADGDYKAITSGTLNLVNAIAVFLPPPISAVTEILSGVADFFLNGGGGTTDTATLIQNGFEEQAELIVEQFNRMKQWTGQALDSQTLEEMTFLAQGVLATLSSKLLFLNSFRDEKMTEDLARDIKNEIQVFEHSTDITRLRLVFNSYCGDIFQAYGTYATNTDKQERDKACLFMLYVYVMLEMTGKSVLTGMITKLTASGTDYLTEMGYAFLKVQEYRTEATKTWLNNHFKDNSVLICAAFRYDSTMWESEQEKDYALIYIGAIDPDLKQYIEDFHCNQDSLTDNNVRYQNMGPIETSRNNKLTTLNNWGESFIVDFFFRFTVCHHPYMPWVDKAILTSYKCICKDRTTNYKNAGCWEFSLGDWQFRRDKSVFQITNNQEKTFGYNLPNIVMDHQNEMEVWLPLSGDWKKKIDHNM